MIINIKENKVSGVSSCNTHGNDEGDGVGRDEQAGGESGEVTRATHGSANAGLGERNHPVRTPLSGTLAEILA